jgi:hypothetical protein
MEAMRRRMEDLERVVEDDYKFLNRNMWKLFGMGGHEEQVVQELREVPLGNRVPPLGFL